MPAQTTEPDAPQVSASIKVTYSNDMGHYEPIFDFPPELSDRVRALLKPAIYQMSWGPTIRHVAMYQHGNGRYFTPVGETTTRAGFLQRVNGVVHNIGLDIEWVSDDAPGKDTAVLLKDLPSGTAIHWAPAHVINICFLGGLMGNVG